MRLWKRRRGDPDAQLTRGYGSSFSNSFLGWLAPRLNYSRPRVGNEQMDGPTTGTETTMLGAEKSTVEEGRAASGREAAAGEVRELIQNLFRAPSPDPELVNHYYTLCIPFYREFLGNHWHTGYYLPHGPTGPQDQLRMERRIAESADLASACDVLEVGCGIGGPACHLASRTSVRYRGLTPNVVQLELARKLARESNLQDRVSFDLGSASELPYPDESFDVVLFFES